MKVAPSAHPARHDPVYLEPSKRRPVEVKRAYAQTQRIRPTAFPARWPACHPAFASPIHPRPPQIPGYIAPPRSTTLSRNIVSAITLACVVGAVTAAATESDAPATPQASCRPAIEALWFEYSFLLMLLTTGAAIAWVLRQMVRDRRRAKATLAPDPHPSDVKRHRYMLSFLCNVTRANRDQFLQRLGELPEETQHFIENYPWSRYRKYRKAYEADTSLGDQHFYLPRCPIAMTLPRIPVRIDSEPEQNVYSFGHLLFWLVTRSGDDGKARLLRGGETFGAANIRPDRRASAVIEEWFSRRAKS